MGTFNDREKQSMAALADSGRAPAAIGQPSQKIQCVKVTRPDSHGDDWCLYRLAGFSAADEFDGAELGERVTLELCEMTEAELDALPEFGGW